MKSATAPQRAGACRAVLRCWKCGFTSSSDLIYVAVSLFAMKSFSYALRDLCGSEFYVVSKSVGGLVATTRLEPLQSREEPVRVGPFRDVVDAAIHHPLI